MLDWLYLNATTLIDTGVGLYCLRRIIKLERKLFPQPSKNGHTPPVGIPTFTPKRPQTNH